MRLLPPPALLALEQNSLRTLQLDDASYLLTLLQMEHNQAVIDGLYESDTLCLAFLEAVKASIWSIPMLCLYNGKPIGLTLTTGTDLQNLNVRLITLFELPMGDQIALLLYIRHLFWSFPLQRIYVRFPSTRQEHIRLYQSIGFQLEGTLPAHQMIAGMYCDVVLLGLLRQDFDAWCHQYDQRFLLERRST